MHSNLIEMNKSAHLLVDLLYLLCLMEDLRKAA